MIPLCVPNLTGNEEKYLQNCIRTNFVSTVGTYVTQFEDKIKNITSSKHCIATSSGTSALHLTLHCLNIESNDLVLCPSYSFIASANAIKHCKAEPIFIDIDTSTSCVSAEKLEIFLSNNCNLIKNKCIHKNTKKQIKALIVVFTVGSIPNIKKLKDLTSNWGIKLIADSACSLGITTKSINYFEFFEASIFSFNGNKTFTCGGGGAIITNNKDFANKLRHVSTTARVGKDYCFDQVGFNYRLTNLQAAVGLAQLEQFDNFVNKKHEIFNFYIASLKPYDKILLPLPGLINNLDSIPWLATFTISNDKLLLPLITHLNEKGIMSRNFWQPLNKQTPYKDSICSDIRNSKLLSSTTLVLPSSTNITSDELITVTKAIIQFIKNV